MTRRVAVLTPFAILLGACTSTPPQQQPQDVSTEIRVANEEFVAALTQQDAQALAGLYTADAQLLPPNGDFVTGRSDIETFWQGVMDAGVAAAALTTVEAIGTDSLAYEVGRYIMTDANGATIDEGKYIVIWRRGADGWKLHRDIWNSSQPPA